MVHRTDMRRGGSMRTVKTREEMYSPPTQLQSHNSLDGQRHMNSSQASADGEDTTVLKQ
ncbi:hypothetical protein SARC_18288, partial [Sphaeroforma arctica JP610]